MGIFDKRINYKPFEYPEVLQFTDAIHKTFWVHGEINFTADVQDYHTRLTPAEKEVVKRSMLGISQVEVAVKSFWGDLYKLFPKPEMNGLGATLAHNEFVHSESYSHILTILGLEREFENLITVPVFRKKLEVIEKHLTNNTDVVGKLLFFTLIIENTSLFGHFANVLSLTRFKGVMKNISNIIAYTSIDETLHSSVGIYLINKIREEGHTIDEDYIKSACLEYIKYEEELLDWIYEEGELTFFSKVDMINFMKYRMDEALVKCGVGKIFNVTSAEYSPMKWFDEEVFSNALDDFFAKKPTDYTKHDKSIDANDLF